MADNGAPVKPERGVRRDRAVPRTRPRTEYREQRRAEFVRAAIAAIRKYGPDVAMEHIAAEAGITKPILYRYFRDKGDLYMAVSEHVTLSLRAVLLSGLDVDGDPRELLRMVIDTYLTFIQQDPEVYRFVVRRSFPDRPVQRDPVTTNNELIAGRLTTIFSARLRALGMESGGAATWAHAGVGMVQAAGDWWLEQEARLSQTGAQEAAPLGTPEAATLGTPEAAPLGTPEVAPLGTPEVALSREALRDYLLMMVWGALDGILNSGGSPTRMLADEPVLDVSGVQLPTEKPTRRLSEGPIST